MAWGGTMVGVIGMSDKTPLTIGMGNREMHQFFYQLQILSQVCPWEQHPHHLYSQPTSLFQNSLISNHQSKQLSLMGFITHVSPSSLRNCSRLATMASECLTHKVILVYATLPSFLGSLILWSRGSLQWWASSSDMLIYPSIFAFPSLSLHRWSTTMHLHSDVTACDHTTFALTSSDQSHLFYGHMIYNSHVFTSILSISNVPPPAVQPIMSFRTTWSGTSFRMSLMLTFLFFIHI